MRKSAATPGGKPDILFHVPETVGFEIKVISVSDSDLNIANHVLRIQRQPVYHNIDLHNLLNCYVHLNEISIPKMPKKHWMCAYPYLDAYQTIHLRFSSRSFEETKAATERYSLKVVVSKFFKRYSERKLIV